MKLAFFTLTGWSIGKIEREVSEFFPADWQVKWYDFRECHDPDQFQKDLSEGYQFVSPGYAATVLMSDYSIPPERIFYIVYDENEFERTISTLQSQGKDVRKVFDSFLGYGVFSDILRNVSIARGIHRIPHVLGLGLHVGNYTYKHRDSLNVLGYAQKWQRLDTPQGFDIKRGPLARAVADRTGLEFRNTNLEIEGASGGPELDAWYQGVDCLLVPSLIEGGPLAPFEAAACGIPTIGTPVGHLAWFGVMGAAIIVDPRPAQFIRQATQIVEDFRRSPGFYHHVCAQAANEVEHFDWKYAHRDWVEFFSSV